jgi:hypothetical protein
MQIVFKVVTIPAPALPVVADTNVQDHYTGINSQYSFKELVPHIQQATDTYVIPFIGEELYNDLAAKYQAGTALTSEQSRTLHLLQRSVIHYAMYRVMSDKVTAITGLGIMQNAPDGGANPTNQWGFTEKKLALLQTADDALDQLLTFLDKQTAVYFDLWKNSAAFDYKRSNFIKTTADLDEYLNLQKSRRSFVSIVPFIASVERDVLKPILCTGLYDLAILAATDATRALLPYIKELVAYEGAARALPHHRVVVDGDGFRVVSQTDGFQDRRNQTNSVHQQAVGALLSTYQQRSASAKTALVKFLESNLDAYPTYRDSDCRTAPKDKGHGIQESKDRLGAVGIW